MGDKLTLVLEVKDDGTPVIKRFGMESTQALNQATQGSTRFGASLGELNSSWAMMAAGMASTIYLAQQMVSVANTFARPFKDAYMATEDYNLSITRMAALITNFKALKPGEDLAESYRQSRDYAEGLLHTLEIMAPKVFGSAKDLGMMTEEFAKQGVLLDINNKKEIDAFANIANAVGVVAAGYQNREMQIRQESRALMEGVVKPTNVLAGQVQALVDGPLKEKIKLWKQEGTVIENIGLLLKGYSAASGDISGTWQSIKTTMETIYAVILRTGLGDIYKDLNKSLLEMNAYLMNNKDNIITPIREIWQSIKAIIGDISFVKMIQAGEGFLNFTRDTLNFIRGVETSQDKTNKLSEELQTNLRRIKEYQDQISKGTASSWLNSFFGVGYEKDIQTLKARNVELLEQFKAMADSRKEENHLLSMTPGLYKNLQKPILDVKVNTEDLKKAEEELRKMRQASAEDYLHALEKETEEQGKAMKKEYEAEQKLAKEILELGQKSLEESLLAREKEVEEQGKLMRDEYERERKYSIERVKMEADIYKDIRGYAVEHYQAERTLIDSRVEAMREAGVNAVAIREWENEQNRKALLAQAGMQDDFFGGVKAGFNDLIATQKHFGQYAIDLTKEIWGPSGAVSQTLGSFFKDTFKGELKSGEDYFNAFKDRIISAFSTMLAQMAVDWALKGGKTLLTWLTAEEGMWKVPGGENGEVPIIAHPGEMILPRDVASAVRNYFEANEALAGFGTASGGLIGAYLGGMAGRYIGGQFGQTGGQIGGIAGSAAGAYLGAQGGAALMAYLTNAAMAAQTATTVGIGGAEAAAGSAYGSSAAAGGAGAAVGVAGIFEAVAPYLPFIPMAVAIGMGWYSTSTSPTLGKTWSNPFIPGELAGEAAVMAAGGGFAMPSKQAMAAMNADPWFDPNNMYTLWMNTFGTPPTADQLGSNGAAGHFFRSQPHWLDWVAKLQEPGMLMPMEEAYQMYQGYNPWAAGAAEGAFITEPMLAIGKSGKPLWIGEKGLEYVGPVKGRSEIPLAKGSNAGGNTYNYHFHFDGPVFAEEEYIERKIYPVMEELRKYGH